MKEVQQVNILIPSDIWKMVEKIVAKRTLNDEGGNTKKKVVADAIKFYYESQK